MEEKMNSKYITDRTFNLLDSVNFSFESETATGRIHLSRGVVPSGENLPNVLKKIGNRGVESKMLGYKRQINLKELDNKGYLAAMSVRVENYDKIVELVDKFTVLDLDDHDAINLFFDEAESSLIESDFLELMIVVDKIKGD